MFYELYSFTDKYKMCTFFLCTVRLTRAPSICTQTQWPLLCDGTVSILCSLHPALFLFAQPSKCTHLVIPNGGNPRQGLFSALSLPVTQTFSLFVFHRHSVHIEHVKLTSPSAHLLQCEKSFFSPHTGRSVIRLALFATFDPLLLRSVSLSGSF